MISRISNKRVKSGRYLGSAIVSKDNAGHLITGEYHQLKPNNKKDIYLLLYFLRTKEFMQITELASGTAGQQRIQEDILLTYPITVAIDNRTRKKAEEVISKLEKTIKHINKLENGLDLLVDSNF